MWRDDVSPVSLIQWFGKEKKRRINGDCVHDLRLAVLKICFQNQHQMALQMMTSSAEYASDDSYCIFIGACWWTGPNPLNDAGSIALLTWQRCGFSSTTSCWILCQFHSTAPLSLWFYQCSPRSIHLLCTFLSANCVSSTPRTHYSIGDTLAFRKINHPVTWMRPKKLPPKPFFRVCFLEELSYSLPCALSLRWTFETDNF
jgi:hypothetical protein